MGEKYWVRHRSLAGFVGPLTKEQLRAAVVSGSLPAAAETRAAAPDGRAEVLDDSGWMPLHDLLGIAAPPAPQPKVASPAPGARGVRPGHLLADLRQWSQYGRVRRVAGFLAIVLYAGVALFTLVTLVALTDARRVTFAAVLAVLLNAVISLAVIHVVHHALQMLADLADCGLRAESDRASRRVGKEP